MICVGVCWIVVVREVDDCVVIDVVFVVFLRRAVSGV